MLSLTAKGLTTGEVSAHFAEIFGVSVSKDTVSAITDKVVAEMTDWCNRLWRRLRDAAVRRVVAGVLVVAGNGVGSVRVILFGSCCRTWVIW